MEAKFGAEENQNEHTVYMKQKISVVLHSLDLWDVISGFTIILWLHNFSLWFLIVVPS